MYYILVFFISLLTTHLVFYLLILGSVMLLSLLINLFSSCFHPPCVPRPILQPLSPPITSHFVTLVSALALICTATHGALLGLS